MQPLVAARTCLLPATVPRPILQVDADVHDLYRSWCGDDVICVWRKSAFNRTIQHGALHWCARGLNPGTHAVKYDGVARPSKCRAVDNFVQTRRPMAVREGAHYASPLFYISLCVEYLDGLGPIGAQCRPR